MTRTFTGEVTREDGWWVAVLDDNGPATHGRSLDELYKMVIDLVDCFYEIPPDEFEVHLRLPVRLSWVRRSRWPWQRWR